MSDTTDNSDATLILSLVGLPLNWKEMEFWLMEDATRPKLVLTNDQVYDHPTPLQHFLTPIVLINDQVYELYDPINTRLRQRLGPLQSEHRVQLPRRCALRCNGILQEALSAHR